MRNFFCFIVMYVALCLLFHRLACFVFLWKPVAAKAVFSSVQHVDCSGIGPVCMTRFVMKHVTSLGLILELKLSLHKHLSKLKYLSRAESYVCLQCDDIGRQFASLLLDIFTSCSDAVKVFFGFVVFLGLSDVQCQRSVIMYKLANPGALDK